MAGKEITFEVALRERNAIQIDGDNPAGTLTLVFDATQAASILQLLKYQGQTFVLKVQDVKG
jgi:hypothetical protein